MKNRIPARSFFLSILFVLLININLSSYAQSSEYQVIFEPGDCLFDIPSGYSPECGYLVVPEDRNQVDGAVVRLHVAIFRSTNPNPLPDPLIYLSGGGGANELLRTGYYLSGVGDAVLENRDFIMYNQRGSDFTLPSLDCGFTQFLKEHASLSISQEERNTMTIDFWLACMEGLQEQGINLDTYSTTVNAADANDLRIALGYQQANFYGTSYGTRLGLDLIRDYPEGVRSLILDSVYPPHIDYYSEYASNAQYAFNLVFNACIDDTDCNSRYPNLETIFYETVDELNFNPLTLNIWNQDIVVDGAVFMEAIYAHLYSAQNIPAIPLAIFEANAGSFDQVENYIAGGLEAEFINLAVWYSMVCQEETPFDNYDNARTQSETLRPQITDFYVESFANFHFTLCESWAVSPANPIESQAIVSDVPTLVLAGQFDPITPSIWGQNTSEYLENSFFYEFRGLAHGIMRSNACGLEIGLQFIDNPEQEPDASCMEQLSNPDFH